MCQVVVLTNTTITKQVDIDEFCREKGIYFIAADVRGLFGYVQIHTQQVQLSISRSSVFNDFGNDFACVDPTGENPQTGMVVNIEEVRNLTCYFARRGADGVSGRGCHGDLSG
jgi:ubiquitin-activating enzyme E1